jgi:hypothetical protein
MPVSNNIKRGFVQCIATFIIFLFVYTGISKLLAHHSFRLVFLGLRFPPFWAQAFSLAIPILEMLIAACIFFPSTRRLGLAAAMALMTIFTIFIAGMLLLSSHLPCSCGGVLATLGWKSHLFFNIATTLVTCIAWRLCPKQSPRSKIVLQYTGAAENL